MGSRASHSTDGRWDFIIQDGKERGARRKRISFQVGWWEVLMRGLESLQTLGELEVNESFFVVVYLSLLLAFEI